MYCLCVNVYYCHRVTSQLQLTNIYHKMYLKNPLLLSHLSWGHIRNYVQGEAWLKVSVPQNSNLNTWNTSGLFGDTSLLCEMDSIPTCMTQSSICTGGRHYQIPFHPSIQITRSDMWSASYCPLHPRGTRSAIPRDKSNITIALSSHIKQNDTKMFQRKSLIIRNMKVLSLIAFGVFALGVVTFKSVASLPKLKSAAGTPFDWQQFLPGGKIFNFSVPFFFFDISLLFVDPPPNTSFYSRRVTSHRT